MVDQLVLRPLPGVQGGDHAAYLQFRSIQEPERTQGRRIATLDFDDLRRSANLIEGIASFGNIGLKISVDDARPISVMGNTIYGDFFETLRAWPASGRLLSASETQLGSDPLKAVLSEDLARQLFGSVHAAPAQSLLMNGHTVEVVGVAGGGFLGAERGVRSDVWLPYGALVPLVGFTGDRLTDREAVMHGDIIMRPRPGVEPSAVVTQIAEILQRLATAGNESGPYLADLRPRAFQGLHIPPLVREITYSSLALLGTVVFLVLLLTCANVANLLLFRNVHRRGVVATLRALGASRGRIARQHLVLSLILGALGTLAGIATGWIMALPFKGAKLTRMPAFEGLVLDTRVLLFAGGMSILTAVLFGTIPAIFAGRGDLAGSLRNSSQRGTDRGSFLRSTLSTVQLSLSLALLVGTLLLVRTMRNLHSIDFGLDTDEIAALTIDPPRSLTPPEQEELYRRVLAAVEELPEVSGAAGDPYGPFGPTFGGRIGTPGASDDQVLRTNMVPVTPGWLELLSVRMVTGRPFEESDWRIAARPSVILTESLAHRLFGTTNVAGLTVEAGFVSPEPMTILGVAGDIRSPFAPDEVNETFFVTPAAMPGGLPFFTVLMRVASFTPEVAVRIRSAVEAALPDEPVPDPALISARLDEIHSEARIYSRLLTLLSALAVFLSAVGLYAIVAFTVAARRREFGVRLALGAGGSAIAALVARNASAVIGAGTLFGLGGAYVLSRLLQSRLFGVAPSDPASFAMAGAIFAAATVVACWVPTRRAIGVDPATTLREE
jgi:predicted permease